jgi:hypothetical protein
VDDGTGGERYHETTDRRCWAAGHTAMSQVHKAEQECNGVVMVQWCSFCSPAIERLLAVYLLPRYMTPLLVALQHFQPAV